MRAIYGQKLMMTRIFDKQGREVPITLIMVKDNFVSQVKTSPKEDYIAIQLAAGEKKRLNRAEKGQFDKLKIKPVKIFEIETKKKYQVGDRLTADIFQEGEKINVTSVSKGKGFAGTIKRHGFHLGPKTHGGDSYRRPGSIGSMFPQRVVKGRKMAGHLGAQQVTTKNLKITKIFPDKSLILVRGSVPGGRNSWVKLWSENED